MSSGEQDVSLSFESLLFGEDEETGSESPESSPTRSSVDESRSPPQCKKARKGGGEEKGKRSSGEMEIPKSSAEKARRERSLSISEYREYERDKNAVFIHSAAEVLAMSLLLEKIEKLCGSLKTYHYRDKQSFCFVQFESEERANQAVRALHLHRLDDGTELHVERCRRVTPGKDPRRSETEQIALSEHNSTLVIKNLPFSLKQDQLKDVLSSYDVQPESVAFHYDASGMFRGMAFIKYHCVDDAVAIFDVINGMDVGGRPIRVEYKRKKKEHSKGSPTVSDPNDDEMKKLYEQLMHFKDSTHRRDLTFPPSLTSYQRRQIHRIAGQLGMEHYMEGEGEHRYLIVSKTTLPIMASVSAEGLSSPGIQINQAGRRDRRHSLHGDHDLFPGNQPYPLNNSYNNHNNFHPHSLPHRSTAPSPYHSHPHPHSYYPQGWHGSSPRSYGTGTSPSWRSRSKSGSSWSASSQLTAGNYQHHPRQRGHYPPNPVSPIPPTTPNSTATSSSSGYPGPRGTARRSSIHALPPSPPSHRSIHVIRHPKGPDGPSRAGFAESYQKRRMNLLFSKN